MSTTSKIRVENWENVDFSQMAEDLDMEERKLRESVGLKPFSSFSEAIKALEGAIAQELYGRSNYEEEPRIQDVSLIDDCLECAGLEDIPTLEKYVRMMDVHQANRLLHLHNRLSEEATESAKSVSDCVAISKLVSTHCFPPLVYKWLDLAETKEELLEFGKKSRPFPNDQIKELFFAKLRPFYIKNEKVEPPLSLQSPGGNEPSDDDVPF